MPTKLFLMPFCARCAANLTSNLKRYHSTTGYLQLRLIGQFPRYIKSRNRTSSENLLAVFEEKLAELTIIPKLAITLKLAPPIRRDDVSQKGWSSFLI